MSVNLSQRRGFTLVEATMSVVLVGGLLVASTGTFGAIARNRRSQVDSRTGLLLGQQLMDEILQNGFQQPGTSTPVFGPIAGQSRPAFNYVDAYDGYSASPPASQSGAALTDYAGWSESVAVSFVDPLNPANVSAASTLKRITVTVTSPTGVPFTLVGYRSKYGSYEYQPSVQSTYVTGVTVTVQGATPAKTIYGGSHPLNITTSQ